MLAQINLAHFVKDLISALKLIFLQNNFNKLKHLYFLILNENES